MLLVAATANPQASTVNTIVYGEIIYLSPAFAEKPGGNP